MANKSLKELLGEKYRDDLTAAEIETELASLEPGEATVSKSLYDRLASEHNALKKKAKELEQKELSEAELLKAQLTELETELADARKQAVKASVARVFEGAGLAEKDYKTLLDLAVLQPDGESALAQAKQLVKLIQDREKEKEASVRAQILAESPKPEAGTPPKSLGKDEFLQLDLGAKQKLYQENPELFNQLAGVTS